MSGRGGGGAGMKGLLHRPPRRSHCRKFDLASPRGGRQVLGAWSPASSQSRWRNRGFEIHERLCLVPDRMRGEKGSEESERTPVFGEGDSVAPSTETES